MGRWLNRDMLENADRNIVAYINNHSVNSNDLLGREELATVIEDNNDKEKKKTKLLEKLNACIKYSGKDIHEDILKTLFKCMVKKNFKTCIVKALGAEIGGEIACCLVQSIQYGKSPSTFMHEDICEIEHCECMLKPGLFKAHFCRCEYKFCMGQDGLRQ